MVLMLMVVIISNYYWGVLHVVVVLINVFTNVVVFTSASRKVVFVFWFFFLFFSFFFSDGHAPARRHDMHKNTVVAGGIGLVHIQWCTRTILHFWPQCFRLFDFWDERRCA